jgi:lysophospholipase L1-like esterase
VKPIQLRGKLVCVGDSITYGESVTSAQSYVGLLQAKVAAEHLPLKVIRQGRSGWSTADYLAHRDEILDAMPADATIVTILLGTNDSRAIGSPSQIGRDTAANLAQLIDLYRQKIPTAQFVIMAPTQIFPKVLSRRLRDAHYGDEAAANLKEITAAFKSLAAQQGPAVHRSFEHSLHRRPLHGWRPPKCRRARGDVRSDLAGPERRGASDATLIDAYPPRFFGVAPVSIFSPTAAGLNHG